MKQVVHYAPHYGDFIKEGRYACIVPVDHPSEYVSNGEPATTSAVVFYDPETGVFETANTRYVPL